MTTPARTTTGDPGSTRQRPAYRLAREPDGTSWTARENLTDILRRELLGPVDGEREVLGVAPDDRYLLGRIAPVRLADARGGEGAGVPVGSGTADPEDTGDTLPGADEDERGPDSGGEDSAVEDAPANRGLMIPASMGLRCQLPLDVGEVTVHASWGRYEPVSVVGPDGRRIRRFVRTPEGVSTRLRLADLESGRTTAVPLREQVVLRVDRYDDPPTDLSEGRVLVEMALCNDQVSRRPIPVGHWLHQTELRVEAGGREVFLPVRDVLADARPEPDDELRRLELQYRDRLEFAIGRTCSVDWTVAPAARRATEVRTTWLPVAETPQVSARDIPGVLTDMTVLARASADELRSGLTPLVDAYAAWLDDQRAAAAALPGHLRGEAVDSVEEAEQARDQLAEGIETLLGDAEARRCFAFMNEVMAEQRVHSQVVEARAKDPSLPIRDAERRVRDLGAKAHAWRPFQLAFVLMQIPALLRPDHWRRSGDLARVELLFFPTGGGKTEAYLGLAAYTFAVRRRQGLLHTPDGDLDGRDGVAVLMRYTLRLLTAQQFQRATTLVCAAEMVRQRDEATWGTVPFRIGLWVGTDVSPKRVSEADEQLTKVNEGRSSRLTVLQVQRCPWCGSPIGAPQVHVDDTEGRVRVHCSDDLGSCPFGRGSAGPSGREGLPLLTVDEEIYRLTPIFLIATVDKFARLAREGEAASIFGHVGRWCQRHGYVHPDSAGCGLTSATSRHPGKGQHPPAGVVPVPRLRPPDLVIQDELHLISGSLGTTVGLFEVAVDVLTTWLTPKGAVAKPLVVASSATVRNVADQVRGLYARDAAIFPPQVLDASDTFFATTVEVAADRPGRRYLGVSPTGVRMTKAEIRVAEVLLAAGQLLLDRDPEGSPPAADPQLTLVGYFNATRELAGMARYLSDDIRTLLARGRPWSALPRRRGTAYGNLHVSELTSRVSSADITRTLDRLAVPFDGGADSSQGRLARTEERRAARTAGTRVVERRTNPFDVVLATSMLQVGVDVTRLGLMLLVGQPKNTAEYIQASSRVGRDPARPGLVVTLGNWARPRDLAHFEQFRHYHETFYQQVEALSVTPFSQTSLERGLDGVLVSAARVSQGERWTDGLSAEKSAGRIAEQGPEADALVARLVARIRATGDEDGAEQARQRLVNRLDCWRQRRTDLLTRGQSLAYERTGRSGEHGALLVSPENAAPPGHDGPPFAVPNSMRAVQPEINLLLTPDPDKLLRRVATDPEWAMPDPGEDGPA